ncbi:MAG: replication initiation protein [Gammaproteobacteria bacterium]
MITCLSNEIERKVHKHVSAIHCSGQLSLFQRKIINCLLFHAYPNLETESRFKIHIRELLDLMGLKNNDYRYLREAFREIRKTDITWNLTSEQINENDSSDEFESWIDCSWLSWAMSDGSYIHYEFPAPLKSYLVDPSIYASISLRIQQKFTSKFALILYENCLRYIKIGKTKLFEINTFRSIMGVTDEQYKIFRDFNARVLKPAITQVNHHTDIDVEVVLKRVRRKVVAIQFLVKWKVSPEEKSEKKNNFQGPKILGVAKALIDKMARPGESYEQAAERIKKIKSKST